MSPPLQCLVADDHPAMVEAVSTVLGEQGIEIVGTTSEGEQAAEKIDSSPS